VRYFVEIHELHTELSVFEARGVANFGTRCTMYVDRSYDLSLKIASVICCEQV